jgi:hypothetical protein
MGGSKLKTKRQSKMLLSKEKKMKKGEGNDKKNRGNVTPSMNEKDMAINKKKHAIEMLEKKYIGKLINTEDVESKGYGDFLKWLRGMTRFGNVKSTMLFFDHDERINVIFFTSDHRYSISARLPNSENDGYLGCIANCRKPRVGETWTRGSDLADGNYSERTFVKIMADIVSYEIKNLQCFK